MTHKTKGIVLKSIRYGDTSIIVSIFTELFGIQKYIVKGIRKNSKTSFNKITYFQPGSILDLDVYKNEQKELQFIKEYTWFYRYDNIYFNVIKNAITTYLIELFSNAVLDSERNDELYDFLENYLILTETETLNNLSNLPLFFTLNLSKLIGFQINGEYNSTNNIIDLLEGSFVNYTPMHEYFIPENLSEFTSMINNSLENPLSTSLSINRKTRQELLNYYELYFTLHIENFKKLKSLSILQNIL